MSEPAPKRTTAWIRKRRCRPSRSGRHAGPWLGGAIALLVTATMPAAATPSAASPSAAPEAVQPVLRVGVVDGSPPCSYSEAGGWRGLAVDLWNRIATGEGIPYVVSEWSSVQDMLEASRDGRLDVAVGCINVSPERLQRYRFTLPFQEDGLAVMVMNSRLDLGRAFLGSLVTPMLLQLLGGYLLVIALLSLLTWRVEKYAQQPLTLSRGRMRSFSKVFQVLATGPGGNTIVATTRGDGIVIMAYLVRIVAASLLVGYLTVNVAREVQGRASGRITSTADLLGLRVAVRRGTVSEALLQELNGASTGPKVEILSRDSIRSGIDLLISRQADAVLGDNLQLSYHLLHIPSQGLLPTLALQGIRPESQAFALSPALPEATAQRIDLAISALKRSGLVSSLREETTESASPPP